MRHSFVPPAISQPDRLVSLYQREAQKPDSLSSLLWPEYGYYRENARSFQDAMAYLRLPLDIRGPHGNARIAGELVSANYFRALGVEPSIGRAFSPAEGVQPGKAPVAIISDRLWRERFGADPGVIGTTLIIGEGAFTVIGIAPKGFRGVVLDRGELPQIWIPTTMYREAAPMLAKVDILNYWGMRSFLVTARLKNSLTVVEAEAEMHRLGERIDLDKAERAAELRSAGLHSQTDTLPLSRAASGPDFEARSYASRAYCRRSG